MKIIITERQLRLISESVMFTYLKNPEKSPKLGDKYGQDVEPVGYYVTQKQHDFKIKGWLEGTAVLNNPLYIKVSDDTLVQWKYDLSSQYGNKKGKLLTKELMKNGYDGIITVYDDGDTGEIIIFDTNKSIK